jgi:putative ABC transport system permease protein
MDIIEILKDTFLMIRTAKMRSCLTMLGIIIGISAVIILTSIGKGQSALLKATFDKMGKNVLLIMRNKDYRGKFPITSRNYFSEQDVSQIEKNPNINMVTPLQQLPDKFIKILNEKDFTLGEKCWLEFLGVSPSYMEITDMEFLYGRNFSKNEKGNYVIIGDALAEKIFGVKDAIGKKIDISVKVRKKVGRVKRSFIVVGVVKNPFVDMNKVFKGNWLRLLMFIPVEQFKSITGQPVMGAVWCKIRNGIDLNTAGEQIVSEIANMKDSPREIYMYRKMNEWMSNANKSVEKNNLFVALIAAISLLVGGIGIMNIMLVTVTERTREIGIRKAIGARSRDVLFQFLIEAVALTLTGGIVGIILGIFGGKIIGSFMDVTPILDYTAVLVSTLVSIFIGIVFGLYPAKKAAELNPIEALRHE